jgi:hypothetical protein
MDNLLMPSMFHTGQSLGKQLFEALAEQEITRLLEACGGLPLISR